MPFCNAKKVDFSFALVAHRFVFTIGGRNLVGKNGNEALHDVRSIDTQDHSIHASWKEMPSLQVGRVNASACYTNGKLFVFGGYVLHQGNLSSLEVLDLANSLDHLPKWEKIQVDQAVFAPRKNPVVAPASDTTLVIFLGTQSAVTSFT